MKQSSDAGDKKHQLFSHYLSGIFAFNCANDFSLAESELRYSAGNAVNQGFDSLGSRSFIWLAELYEQNGRNLQALESYQSALQLHPGNEDLQLIWGNMAMICKAVGNYTGALSYFEKVYTTQSKTMALSKTSSRDDSLSLMLLIVNIGQLHASLGQCREAMERYRQVQALNSHISYSLLNLYCLEGIAACLAKYNLTDSAIRLYNEALQVSKENYGTSEQINIFNNLGELYLQKNDLPGADRQAALAMALDRSGVKRDTHEDHIYLAATYVLLGRICSQKKDFDGAVQNLSVAVSLYHQLQEKHEESDAWQLLSTMYENKGKPQKALEAFRAHVRLRDSIFSQQTAIELTRIEMNGEFDRIMFTDSLRQAQKDIASKAVLEKQKRDKRFYLAGGILMLIIALVSVWFLLYTRKAKKQIEMLMREMHHRVKNNLQIISTLLNLQLADMHDENAKKTIEEGITRISSIALIHHHLYRVDDMASLEISSFIKELLKQVEAIYIRDGQRLTTSFSVLETTLDVDTAIPLGLALNELMTNSFKYAYAGKDECLMDITLTGRGGTYTITYKDHGPGLPETFDIDTAESLGMRIIQSLAAQLGGNFEFRRAENCFVFTFKDTRQRKHTA